MGERGGGRRKERGRKKKGEQYFNETPYHILSPQVMAKPWLVSFPDLIQHVYHFQYNDTESDPRWGLGPRLCAGVWESGTKTKPWPLAAHQCMYRKPCFSPTFCCQRYVTNIWEESGNRLCTCRRVSNPDPSPQRKGGSGFETDYLDPNFPHCKWSMLLVSDLVSN